ncbi:MAG TPA: TolC family protein [Armatimonadota bacterium]|nr:TolC family protein [Armatimonadota bacterium]
MSRRRKQLVTVTAICVLGSLQYAFAAETPPIKPHIEETTLPPAITLPALPAGATVNIPNEPLTATEAALIALQRQPSITIAKESVTAANGRLQQAKSGLKPSLGFNAAYSDVPISSISNPSEGFTSTIAVQQLLYDFNNTRNKVRQSESLQHVSQANLTKAQSDLVYQVKQAYYTYTQNLRLISVNEANLRNRQEHLNLAKARVDAGVGLPVDVVRAETAVQEAILSLNLAQNSAGVSQVALAQLMDIDPRTPMKLAESEETLPSNGDYQTLLQTAMQQRPEITQAKENLAAAKSGVNVAKTSNYPSFVGSLGYGIRGNEFFPDENTISLGFGVKWTPYDSGLTKGKVTEAQANANAAQAQIESAGLVISTDVSQAYLNEKTAEQRVVTAKAEVANAQEALRLAQGRYAAGLGVFLDVLDAQNDLLTAQTNQVNAQSSVNQARAALAHAINSDPAMSGNH